MQEKRQIDWLRHIDFMLVDLICLIFSFAIAYVLRFGFRYSSYLFDLYRNLILVVCLIQIGVSIATDNLSHVLKRGKADELFSVGLLTALMLALATLYLYMAHNGSEYSRLWLFYSMGVYFVLDYFARAIYKRLAVYHLRKNPNSRRVRSILIVSDSENIKSVINDLTTDEYDHFHIRAVVLVDHKKLEQDFLQIDTLDESLEFICREWVDEVLICLPSQISELSEFVDICAEMGVSVHSVISLSTDGRNVKFVNEIGGKSVLTVSLNHVTASQAAIKRLVDIIGGIIGCVLTIIIGIIIAPFILIQSPGSLLFKQERIGKNGKKFKLLKFRSMIVDADAKKEELQNMNRNKDGMMFKLDFDPRIIGNKVLENGKYKTGIGEFIRKTSLDEFPQFFNVLKGDMSLVGTRPPTVDEWEKYKYHHRARLAQKPGMTGLWQVSGRSNITDFEEVVKLDTEYIANFKLSLDVKILVKTIVTMFKRTGAR